MKNNNHQQYNNIQEKLLREENKKKKRMKVSGKRVFDIQRTIQKRAKDSYINHDRESSTDK